MTKQQLKIERISLGTLKRTRKQKTVVQGIIMLDELMNNALELWLNLYDYEHILYNVANFDSS